jgi:cytochrome c oxidase subunit 1
MTATGQTLPDVTGPAPGGARKGSVLAEWLSTTDHKVIGHLYLITSFGFFMIAGLMAMIMRAQLMGPDNHMVSDQQYNEPARSWTTRSASGISGSSSSASI